MKSIKITCRGADVVDYKKIKDFQGDLKYLSPGSLEKLIAQILKHGFNSPIHIWKNSKTLWNLDGHQRKTALKALEARGYVIPHVPIDFIEAKTVKEAKEILLSKVSEFGHVTEKGLYNFTIDAKIEPIEIKNNYDIPGVDFGAYQELYGDSGGDDGEGEVVPDIPKVPTSKIGDIWILGKHRIMCGDSINKKNVTKLMNGNLADMVFTDPPYNTGMTAQTQTSSGGGTLWKGKGGSKKGKSRLSHMFNDSYTDEEWASFMKNFCSMYESIMKNDSVAYICLDWRRNHELIPHIKDNFKLSNIIIWDKVVHGLGSDYKYTYEMINVCKKGKPNMDTHQGDREYSDVWHIQRSMGRNENHATAKPVELVERCINHASHPGGIIVDLFQGSGTTVIAAEKTKRACYGMEMSGLYVDVIINRWQNLTGDKAFLEGKNKTFEQVKKERSK